MLTKRNWAAIKIGDVSLPHALYCWDITPFAKLTARKQHAAGGRGAEIRAVEGQGPARGREMVNAAEGEVEEIRSVGRRGHRHQNRGDKNSKKHRHTGGRRRTGERNRRRRGRRRNRKGRRRTNSRAKNPDQSATRRTDLHGGEKGSGVPQGKGVNGSDARDSGTPVVTQDGRELSALGGEMLADSPKNPPQDSFIVESNAIDTSQDSSTARTGGRGAERKSGSRRRRRKGKKRSKSKEREKKLRKRERRRKRKERRRKRLQQKKRRKLRERRQGKHEYDI